MGRNFDIMKHRIINNANDEILKELDEKTLGEIAEHMRYYASRRSPYGDDFLSFLQFLSEKDNDLFKKVAIVIQKSTKG